MLFFVVLIIAIVCTIVWYFLEVKDMFVIPCITLSIAVICGIVALIMGIAIGVEHIGVEGMVESNKQRYEILVYQLENDIYDNDNDLGKYQLYEKIQDWNEDLAYKKALQKDFWFGIFYANVYDQFELIDYRVDMNGE